MMKIQFDHNDIMMLDWLADSEKKKSFNNDFLHYNRT